MKELLHQKYLNNKWLFFVSVGVISLLVITDFFTNRLFLTEGVPKFSTMNLIASIICICCTVFIFISLNRGEQSLSTINNSQLALTAFYFVCCISLLVSFLFFTAFFTQIGEEDGVIEWSSAIFMFISCLFYFIYFIKEKKKLLKYCCLVFALVFFVLGMEEVSWFQRVLDIETPDSFEGNIQNEMNLHNFATNSLELIYYCGSFLFLVIGPLVKVLYPKLKDVQLLKVFLPKSFIAILGAIACSYNYDMWNMVPIQITFYLSLGVLILFWNYTTDSKFKALIKFSIILMIISQFSFIYWGHQFDHVYEITEFKEFLIAAGWLAYAWSLKDYFGIQQIKT